MSGCLECDLDKLNYSTLSTVEYVYMCEMQKCQTQSEAVAIVCLSHLSPCVAGMSVLNRTLVQNIPPIVFYNYCP